MSLGDNIIGLPKQATFSIGGDKAYPHVLLPKGWSLFLTKTSEEEESIEQANEANKRSAEVFERCSQSQPTFVHTINGDLACHRTPEIAQSRAVVERVIKAIKAFLILMNISFLSQQEVHFVYKMIVVVAAICNYNLNKRGTSW